MVMRSPDGDVLQALDVNGAGVPVESDDAAGLLCVGICEGYFRVLKGGCAHG